MSRRDNTHLRCPRCRLHATLCVCALLPSIATRTRVALVIHRLEDRKSTNTGRLALACLPNSEAIVRGHEGAAEPPLAVPAGHDAVLLFPHEDAAPITTLAESPRPILLVVPDGTWRQASKVRKRFAGARALPCVTLAADAPSTYRLRAEAHAHGLATFEAIARALGVLEGPAVRRALEDVFRVAVERALWARGQIDARDVSGGIPEGVRRDVLEKV